MSVPCVLNSAIAFFATSDDDIPPAHTINAFFTYIPSSPTCGKNRALEQMKPFSSLSTSYLKDTRKPSRIFFPLGPS